MKNKGEKTELKIELDEILRERFLVVKENTGMQNDKSVLAYLISKAYDKVQNSKYRSLFVSHATYDLIEKAATARGQTIEIYMHELIEDLIRESKECVKHAEN